MTRSMLNRAAIATLVVAFAACTDSSTSPKLSATDLVVRADITADMGAASAGSVQDALGAETLSGSSSLVMAAPGTAPYLVTCSGPDAQGWIGCTGSRENGLSVVRQHRFFGAGGFQLTWGSTTDSAQFRWSVAGADTINGNDHDDVTGMIRWVSRGDTASLRPIRVPTPGQRVWNFHGGRNDSSTVTGTKGTRRYRVLATRVGTNVTWNLPRSTNPWPVSGTLAHAYTATAIFVHTEPVKADTVVKTGTSLVTFNGTQTVTIVVGALTCSLDLSTRKVSACN